MGYNPVERLIWSLSGSGLGTTISASGNSGPYLFTAPAGFGSSPVDLGNATDLALYVYAAGKTGSPSVTVSLNAFAAGGQVFTLMSTAAITNSGAATPVFGGLHGPTAGTYFISPHWGQVAWAYTGTGNLSGVEISLIGR